MGDVGKDSERRGGTVLSAWSRVEETRRGVVKRGGWDGLRLQFEGGTRPALWAKRKARGRDVSRWERGRGRASPVEALGLEDVGVWGIALIGAGTSTTYDTVQHETRVFGVWTCESVSSEYIFENMTTDLSVRRSLWPDCRTLFTCVSMRRMLEWVPAGANWSQLEPVSYNLRLLSHVQMGPDAVPPCNPLRPASKKAALQAAVVEPCE